LKGKKAGITAAAIHENKTQGARTKHSQNNKKKTRK
jgi:hypothetical protein